MPGKLRKEQELKSLQGLISTCQSRPYLAVSLLKKLPARRVQELTGTDSEIREIFHTFRKQFRGHDGEWLSEQWLHGFPDPHPNKLEFNGDGIINDDDDDDDDDEEEEEVEGRFDNPALNLIEKFYQLVKHFSFDEFGAVIVVKIHNGYSILLTDKALTEKKVISWEPDEPFYSRCPVLIVSKFCCLPSITSGSFAVYSRLTGEELYTVQGSVCFLYSQETDYLFSRQENDVTIGVHKLTESGGELLCSVPPCCGLFDFKVHIMTTQKGQFILSACKSCWTARKTALQNGEVVWEIKIPPKTVTPTVWIYPWVESGIFSISFSNTHRLIDTVFVDTELGNVIDIKHDEDCTRLKHLCNEHFIVLTWQHGGFQNFKVYNRTLRLTQELNVAIYVTERLPQLKIIGENILVVTMNANYMSRDVRIWAIDLDATDIIYNMRKMSAPFARVLAIDEGLVELSVNHLGTLSVTRKNYKEIE